MMRSFPNSRSLEYTMMNELGYCETRHCCNRPVAPTFVQYGEKLRADTGEPRHRDNSAEEPYGCKQAPNCERSKGTFAIGNTKQTPAPIPDTHRRQRLAAILLKLAHLRRENTFEFAPGLLVAILLKFTHGDTCTEFAPDLLAAILLKLAHRHRENTIEFAPGLIVAIRLKLTQ